MKYSNGNDVRVGDKVKVSPEDEGVVVCSLDDRNFSPSYPEEEWGYLNVGVVIVTNKLGVVHYKNLDEDIELIERKCKR